MKRVVLLDENDMELISSFIQEIDIEIGEIYNKSVPSELKDNMCKINYYVQELGKRLEIWD